MTDSFSKRIIEHDVSERLLIKGSMSVLTMALKGRKHRKSRLLHHSDRGLHYYSKEYQTFTE